MRCGDCKTNRVRALGRELPGIDAKDLTIIGKERATTVARIYRSVNLYVRHTIESAEAADDALRDSAFQTQGTAHRDYIHSHFRHNCGHSKPKLSVETTHGEKCQVISHRNLEDLSQKTLATPGLHDDTRRISHDVSVRYYLTLTHQKTTTAPLTRGNRDDRIER